MSAVIKKELQNLHDPEQELENSLRLLGFNRWQIILWASAVGVGFMAFVIFLLTGCSLFMDASSIIPSLLSSFVIVSSAATKVASGKVHGKDAETLVVQFDRKKKTLKELNIHGARAKDVTQAAKDFRQAVEP